MIPNFGHSERSSSLPLEIANAFTTTLQPFTTEPEPQVKIVLSDTNSIILSRGFLKLNAVIEGSGAPAGSGGGKTQHANRGAKEYNF